MRNVKTLPPGPGNVFAIKNDQGVIELPSIRTTRRAVIRDFTAGNDPWKRWHRWGYRVVPLTLRLARSRIH